MKIRSFFLLLLICVAVTVHAQPRQGQPAPEISLTDMEGNTVTLSSLKGNIVLIDFWASWCGPCRQSNRHLVKLYDKYKDKGFKIYSISVDNNKAAWQQAVKADKITWLQVSDPGEGSGKVSMEWNIRIIPTSFVMDKEGTLVTMNPTEKELDKYLKANL